MSSYDVEMYAKEHGIPLALVVSKGQKHPQDCIWCTIGGSPNSKCACTFKCFYHNCKAPIKTVPNDAKFGDPPAYCPSCLHEHYNWGSGICKKKCSCKIYYSEKPYLFVHDEAFIKATSPMTSPMYIPAIPAKLGYQDNGLYNTSFTHPESCIWCSVPHPTQPACICTLNCGWKNCSKKHEAKPTSSDIDMSGKSFTASQLNDMWLALEKNPPPNGPRKGIKWNAYNALASPEQMEWLYANADGIITGTVTPFDFWNNLFQHVFCGKNSTFTGKYTTPSAFDKWEHSHTYVLEYYQSLQRWLLEVGATSLVKQYIVPCVTSRPRTQKAKGLKGIEKFNRILSGAVRHQLGQRAAFLCKIEQILEGDNIIALSRGLLRVWTGLTDRGKLKLFARPCPTRPRHGFVDSRVLELSIDASNWQKIDKLLRSIAFSASDSDISADVLKQLAAFVEPLKALAREVKEHDKKGEILLMPFVDAKMSAIYANGAITIGAGNEGATSGDNAIVFPVANVWPEIINADFWKQFGIENSPFLEVVYEPQEDDENKIHAEAILVQLRDGPAMEMRSPDYIPRRVEITDIIIPEPASEHNRNVLLAFESAVENASPTTVVVHEGGAISSHYGIHCVMHGVPYITSTSLCQWIEMWARARDKHPTKPSMLHTTATFILDSTNEDMGAHRGVPKAADWNAGFMAGMRMEALPYAADMIQASLYFLHSSSAIDFSTPAVSYAFAFSLAQSIKLAMIALLGELRHQRANLDLRHMSRDETSISREAIYKLADTIPPELLIRNALEKSKAFGFNGWKGGIGGANWHLCAIEAARLWNACVDFTNHDGDFNDILKGLNNVIHASHNGAKMLTKFSNMATMDLAVKCPPIMGLITVPILWHLINNRIEVEPVILNHGPSVDEIQESLVTDAMRWACEEFIVGKHEYVPTDDDDPDNDHDSDEDYSDSDDDE